MEAGGANNNEQDAVQGEAREEEEGSSSILHSMRKRIRRSRERHMEVVILMQLRCSLNYSAILIGPQDNGSSPASTVEAYLRLPLEEVKCLRYFIRKYKMNGFIDYTAGFGKSLRKRLLPMTSPGKHFSVWFGAT